MHQKPRRALFTPLGTQDGPLLSELMVERTTLVDYQRPFEQVVVDDVWTRPDGRAMLERKWTGRTIFQVKTDLSTQINAIFTNRERTVRHVDNLTRSRTVQTGKGNGPSDKQTAVAPR